MTEYTETEADPNDAEGRVLETLANGMPYAFVVATELEPLNLRVASQHDLGTLRALLVQTLRALPGGMGEVSDGDHTFTELYAHRRALTAVLAAAANTASDSWRSKRHHPDDGPMFSDYFVVGIKLPTGKTITYHYEIEHWDDFAATPVREHAPKWDGSTPDDTVANLLEIARMVADR